FHERVYSRDEPGDERCWEGGGARLLRELVTISIVLRFHLGEELNEFGRLLNALQKCVAGVSRIKMVAADGGLSQPPDGFSALPLHGIDARDVIRGVVIQRILDRMLRENERDFCFRGAEISLRSKVQRVRWMLNISIGR